MAKKIYSPALFCKNHIECGLKHEEYGKCIEVIDSKKLIPILKFILITLLVIVYLISFLPNFKPEGEYDKILQYIVPVIIFGYGVFFLLGTASRVYLYEYGVLYKTLFSQKSYDYNMLQEIALKYDKQYNYDTMNKSILWKAFVRNSYMFYELSFFDDEDFSDFFRLRFSEFSDLDEKIKSLDRNLINTD